jgi:glycosyltransferase involved in cell wall biosynthesis
MQNNRNNISKDILVSICCLTYNHELYIRQCLDSFLMQITDFPYEVLVHDDASIDNTSIIIREYETKFPNIIKPIYQSENKYSKHNGISITYQFPRAKGKYIAMCEGDDYWTDKYKLQKQVDFLNKNQDFTMCCHNVKIIYEPDWKGDKKERFLQPVIISGFEDILDNHFIPTNSLMFRNGLIDIWPEWLSSKNMISGDIPLELMLAYHGKCYYMNDQMAVKRINGGGLTANKKRKMANSYFRYELLYYINKYTNKKYKKIILSKMIRKYPNVIKNSIINHHFSLIFKYSFFIFNTILL